MLTGGRVQFYLWNMIDFKHKDSLFLFSSRAVNTKQQCGAHYSVTAAVYVHTCACFTFFYSIFLIISWCVFFLIFSHCFLGFFTLVSFANTVSPAAANEITYIKLE